MTDSLLRRGQYVVGPVQRRDLDAALALCQRDEVAYVGPLSHVEVALATGEVPHGLWGVKRRSLLGGELCGVLWCGATFTAVLDEDEDPDDVRAHVAAAVVSRMPRPASLVGPQDVTLDLWGRVEPWWGPARELRPRQPSLVIDHDASHVQIDDAVAARLEPMRQAEMGDYDRLLPAAVHMFTAEVGYDPLRHGRAAYEDRLQHLVRLGRSYVVFGDVGGTRDIAFKAEVGVVAGHVAQIQGVWVHPAMRGLRLGSWGMAQLVPRVRSTFAPVVSLYVNDFNAPAIAAYRSAGFREAGTFATVMF